MGPFARAIRQARPTAAERAARRWVYVPYDRLTREVGPLAGADPRTTGAIFVESTEKASRRPYHKKKLAFLLSNERHFALELAREGFRVIYVAGDRPIGEELALGCHERSISRVTVMRPAERELRVDLDRARALGLEVEEVEDATWLTTTSDFRGAFPEGPPFRMDAFYRAVRRRTGILMPGGKPTGGKYSFDTENRRPWKGEPRPPARPSFPPNEITREVMDLVQRRFPDHFGTLDGFDLPATSADAERVWTFAQEHLLAHFGPFEDAMSALEPDLFHSKVSALMNVGRLLAERVVRDVERRFDRGDLETASAEGFIRQVLGWREFVRHVHEATDGFRTIEPRGAPDHLEARRPLPPAYWGAKSGLRCLDTVVEDVRRSAYSHHITRLMVLGNIATLAGFSPRELTDWFWFAYVDAFDWVVEPNVLGMATYADGGLMTTKPYVSGAAYVAKMSDYCKGCRFDPKTALGPRACPLTALYWTFLERNRERLCQNPRLMLPLATQAKKRPAEMQALREAAARAIEGLAAGKDLSATLAEPPSRRDMEGPPRGIATAGVL